MLGKKLRSVKKLAKKVKGTTCNVDPKLSQYECLGEESNRHDMTAKHGGTFAVYVGEDRERFAVPMSCLLHPLFKILLEKARDEFGFEHRHGLVVPCSVATFRKVMRAVESSDRGFYFGDMVEEFVM